MGKTINTEFHAGFCMPQTLNPESQTGVTEELIWLLRLAGPVLWGLRSPAALAE
jgi:hypothetical protein